MSTINNWPTAATEIQDADLLPLKRGTGVNSDKKITGASLKAQFVEPSDLGSAAFDDSGDFAPAAATASEAEAEAGTSTDIRRWTPERIAQAIAALAPSGGAGSKAVYIAAAHNAAAGEVIYINKTSAYTITFPASPVDGDFITLFNYAGSPSNVITLDFQGKDVNDASSAGLVLENIYEIVWLGWSAAQDSWYRIVITETPDLPASPLNNFTATTDPGVGDDDADGYEIGSWWFNTTRQTMWFCADDSTGAAVWLPIFGDAKVRVVAGTSDTLLTTDSGGIVVYTSGSSIAVTIPDTFPVKYHVTLVQAGAGVPTATRSGTDTVNGAATGVTPSAQWKGMYLFQYAAGTYGALK